MTNHQPPMGHPDPGPAGTPGSLAGNGADQTLPTPLPTSVGRGRRTGRILAVGALTVAALGAGAFGLTKMQDSPGADSPGAAVDAFFSAVDDEDALGALETIAPSERDALRRMIDSTVSAGDRGGVTEGVNLGDVSGVDLEVVGLGHTTVELTDDVAAVDLTGGKVNSLFSAGNLPVGKTVRSIFAESGTPKDASDDLELAEIRVMAIRQNGGWYVSPLYTGAEAIRRDADPEPAIPAFDRSGITPIGADSPEAAVQGVLDALETVDVDTMIAHTSPSTSRVLYDYAPVLRSMRGDETPEGPTISGVSLSTGDGPSGATTVTIDRATMTWADDDGTSTTEIRDGCVISTSTYNDYEDWGDDGEPIGEPTPVTETTNSCDYDAPYILPVFLPLSTMDLVFTVVEEDGGWYVDPVDSIAGAWASSFDAMDADSIERLARFYGGADWLSAPDEMWAACGITAPGIDAPIEDGNDALQRCYKQLPDDYEGPHGGAGMFGGGWYNSSDYSDEAVPLSPEDEAYYACFDSGSTAEATACFDGLVADGTITADLVPSAEELAAIDCEQAIDWEAGDDEVNAALDACYAGLYGEFETTPGEGTIATPGGSTQSTAPATSAPATATTAAG